MELTDREKDALEALSGIAKSALSLVPGLGQAIAGWDAYKRSSFERNVKKVLSYLREKVDDFESFFSDEWLKSEEGEQFARKVFDSAFDAQLEDKQQLFINALINGVKERNISNLEKLKFIDILRHLSLAALMVLADMHKMFKDNVRGPGRNFDPLKSIPQVDPNDIAEKLSLKYHPYVVTSAFFEMQSQGLFSNIGEWHKGTDGKYTAGSSFDKAYLAYTDFTHRFVEFITISQNKELENK